MSTDIVLPQLGFSMEDGTIAEWLKGDGEAVDIGEPLYVIESDKSSTEIESPASGTLRIQAVVGELYAVGAVLGVIE